MMGTLVTCAVGAVLFGFGMFLWGTLTGWDRCVSKLERQWVDGFRDGWEACERFDDDVRVVWGDR
jgi:hypothetical protein